MRRYLTEFVGTLFFVMTIGLVITAGNPLAPLVIGATLMVLVYMGGHVSGGHYNPAVSFAVFLRGGLPGRELIPYFVAQIAGGIVGAYLCYMMLDRTFAPEPASTTTAVTALMVETLYTFLLALTVLNSERSWETVGNSYYGLAIGFSIVIAVFAGGPISGGVFNPAVGTGAIAVNALAGAGDWSHLWLYLAGPFLGGALAAGMFRIQQRAV